MGRDQAEPSCLTAHTQSRMSLSFVHSDVAPTHRVAEGQAVTPNPDRKPCTEAGSGCVDITGSLGTFQVVKVYFILFFLAVCACARMDMCTNECRNLQRSEASDHPTAAVTSSCELFVCMLGTELKSSVKVVHTLNL